MWLKSCMQSNGEKLGSGVAQVVGQSGWSGEEVEANSRFDEFHA